MKKYLCAMLTMIMVMFITSCSIQGAVDEKLMEEEVIESVEHVGAGEQQEAIEEDEEEQQDDTETEEEIIKFICETIKTMDYTIQISPLRITREEDMMYKEAYLGILKNEIPGIQENGEKVYFRDLWMLGMEFEELVESACSYYYNDLDGDGLPELGIRSNGNTYILKYEPEINEFSILFSGATMYETILGTGQIWHHNGLHAGYVDDWYTVLNEDNEWENIFLLRRSPLTEQEVKERNSTGFAYYMVKIKGYDFYDIDEKTFFEITQPFFDATENAIPSSSLKEVFGELLDV